MCCQKFTKVDKTESMRIKVSSQTQGNGACHIAAIYGAAILILGQRNKVTAVTFFRCPPCILVSCHSVKSLQLIWRSGIRKWNLIELVGSLSSGWMGLRMVRNTTDSIDFIWYLHRKMFRGMFFDIEMPGYTVNISEVYIKIILAFRQTLLRKSSLPTPTFSTFTIEEEYI